MEGGDGEDAAEEGERDGVSAVVGISSTELPLQTTYLQNGAHCQTQRAHVAREEVNRVLRLRQRNTPAHISLCRAAIGTGALSAPAGATRRPLLA